MSDTSRAAVEKLRKASPIVESVGRRIQAEIQGPRGLLARETAELFFSKSSPDFLHERSEEALAQLAIGAFEFLERSRPERVDVEVFDPEEATEGWTAPVTVIRTNLAERPFIVDTVREFLHSRGLHIEHFVYPVIHVGRNEAGEVTEVGPSAEGSSRESLVHCEVTRVEDPEALDLLESEIRGRLQDVVRATDDFGAMIDALNDSISELAEKSREFPERGAELREIGEFLRWLRDGGFVFLGYREYTFVNTDEGKAIVVEPGSGLGILRDEGQSQFASPLLLDDLPEGVRGLAESGPMLIISKTNAESTVHRRARMDYIGIKKLSEEGEVIGEQRFLGLFTSRTYSEDAEQIPILRQKLAEILDASGLQKGSHDYKETITIFNSMAKEDLFLTPVEKVGEDIQTILRAYNSDEATVTVRDDAISRGVSVMVILPRDRFSGDVRRRIEDLLVEEFGGEVLNYHLAIGRSDQARLQFHMAVDSEDRPEVDAHRLQELVTEIIRTWVDRVREGLEESMPADDARRLAQLYGEAFSAEYRAATRPETAAKDILQLQRMKEEGAEVAISLDAAEEAEGFEDEGPLTELVLFLEGSRLILSDFMPILENSGLRVVGMNPYPLGGPEGNGRAVYVFLVQDSEGQPLDLGETGKRLADAILAVRRGDASNDSLNSLVLMAGLVWREVEVLRAYANYGFQLGAVPSRFSFSTALKKYPEIAGALVRYFQARFDPSVGEDERAAAQRRIGWELDRAMRKVELLSDDRALRRLRILIDSTVRTNYFRHGGATPTRRSGGVPYISFKMDARSLRSIPSVQNRLLYEVWVRSPRMEGIHLRGAKVARGGLRWSDRPDDFRTEVLGLVNTQIVKNAVIVPGGSKGGFVPFRTFADREAMAEEGQEQYKTLIRGLLDLTDNLVGGEPVPPEDVVCHDDPDPYLVVAADKGTAKFSDVANGVAEEYGFWLGDAFASGGSHGYDHKAVRITARGAWECVKRHFREMGKDIQTEPFTVVGIGDMSGDVFGNGMLLSRQIRLLAAFDHRHIFVDPDPDPERTWVERERMFALGRSSWDDYDKSLLSAGGFIVPRGSKEVELTPEAREALGIPDEVGTVDGESLIRHILLAPAELLWNGGIGTYVKARGETHGEVGDASNDPVRVDADELRVQVVGEGGNLGFTQVARIEYALAGGRINTDALDNSGGVDMSDREVNLKVLLGEAQRMGRMDEEARNALLEELTDSEVTLVLADNESQSLAVSLDEVRVGDRLDDFLDLMAGLERADLLDRSAEDLPDAETIQERVHDRGQTLTRPELCVLLAYAKLQLKGAVLRSDLPDDPATEGYHRHYFPARAVSKAGEEALLGHRLRREIIATQLTNDLVDLMGATFAYRVARDTGKSQAEVARAWVIASRLADHREIIERLRAARGRSPAPVVYRWVLGLGRVLERTTRWVLANVGDDEATEASIAENRDGLATLRQRFPDLVKGDDAELFQMLVGELTEANAEPEVARSLITLRFLDQLLEILEVARRAGADVEDAARAYYEVSGSVQTGWLRSALLTAAGDDRWEQRAAQGMHDEVARAHQRLTIATLEGEAGPTEDLRRYQELLERVREDDTPSLSALWAVVRELSSLVR